MVLLPLLYLHGEFYTHISINPQASTAPCLQEARQSALLYRPPDPQKERLLPAEDRRLAERCEKYAKGRKPRPTLIKYTHRHRCNCSGQAEC